MMKDIPIGEKRKIITTIDGVVVYEAYVTPFEVGCVYKCGLYCSLYAEHWDCSYFACYPKDRADGKNVAFEQSNE